MAGAEEGAAGTLESCPTAIGAEAGVDDAAVAGAAGCSTGTSFGAVAQAEKIVRVDMQIIEM